MSTDAFVSDADKTKNYNTCHRRAGGTFPEGRVRGSAPRCLTADDGWLPWGLSEGAWEGARVLQDPGVCLVLFSQGLGQSRHTNVKGMNEWSKWFILLEVLMASDLLRGNLYSNTNFRKNFTFPSYVESSTSWAAFELELL